MVLKFLELLSKVELTRPAPYLTFRIGKYITHEDFLKLEYDTSWPQNVVEKSKTERYLVHPKLIRWLFGTRGVMESGIVVANGLPKVFGFNGVLDESSGSFPTQVRDINSELSLPVVLEWYHAIHGDVLQPLDKIFSEDLITLQ